MGVVQSGPHSLGDVTLSGDSLWVQERQRHKNSRGGNRYEHSGGSSSTAQEQTKLLKRSRSLAVVSEENRENREGCCFRLGEPTDILRRQQLIPRAKLNSRHSLKDRLSKSQQHLHGPHENLTPKLYQSELIYDSSSFLDPPNSLPNPAIPRFRANNNNNPDRLNILNWPDPPKRYQSVQALDNVSGLVDVVEENWSTEGNRSIDCIYTQVKRKRKEHRSLDSVLFESEGELEYINVLDLLPLSSVRLEYEDSSRANNSSSSQKHKTLETGTNLSKQPSRSARGNFYEDLEKDQTLESNITDEQKSRNHSESLEPQVVEALNEKKIKHFKRSRNKSRCSSGVNVCEQDLRKCENRVLVLETDEDKYRADVALVTPIEEAEDYKSLWISDSEEPEEMSRRPQVLKIVDNDVTKRSRSISEMENIGEERVEENESEMASNTEETDVETARNYFEKKRDKDGEPECKQSEGKIERIIKGTSSIIGKACNAVKGSLGFETRSENVDLNSGNESPSENNRGQSIDNDVDVVDEVPKRSPEVSRSDNEKNHSNLARSQSYTTSVPEEKGQEFNHIRYKIMKSDVFSKNLFGSMKNDVAFDGLMQYLQEYSIQDLLVDNNVVIIEPVRAESSNRKTSMPSLSKNNRNPPTCRIAGAIQKKSLNQNENQQANDDQQPSAKQSNLRRHFFYHPIRVNRELIDEELPDPDIVRNVRQIFEKSLKLRTPECEGFSGDCKSRKSISMKDLSQIDGNSDVSEKTDASRCSSRAKDLTRLFENMEKHPTDHRDDLDSPRSESKTRIIAQSFEARSGHTSPSESTTSKHKIARYLHNWDAGSVSSGVSSDYPDTDPGSGAQCTSSEDEDGYQDDDDAFDNNSNHYVSPDVLKKIRECGTSVTYYGGKVVNTCNSPLISPMSGKMMKRIVRNDPDSSKDYVKLRLVKSNSCDSRLELTGRFVDEKFSLAGVEDNEKSSDLRKSPIMEEEKTKKEPPIVIGLEPKKEEVKDPEVFRADFKLGKLGDTKCYANKFDGGGLKQWQVNDGRVGEEKSVFGGMDFEEFEVMEDSLNANVNRS